MRTSPFRSERNPWVNDEDLHHAMLCRGSIVASMGAIETRLTELAIAASKHDSYYDMRANFPSRRPARINYLRSLQAAPGPLSDGSRLLDLVLNRFEGALELRDLCAHANMQVLSGPGEGWEAQLQDYFADGAAIKYRQRRIGSREFERHAVEAASLSRAVDRLFRRAMKELPPIHGAPA